MLKKHATLICLAIGLLISCKDDKKKEDPISEEELKTVVQFRNPSEENSQLPRLFSTGKALYFSWVTTVDNSDKLHYAVLNNDVWSLPSEIAQGTDWFTNWADFPAIAENNGNILSSYLQKSDTATYTYDIKLAIYNAEEQKWNKDLILHDDNTKSEHGFVSILPFEESDFFATWLDGRNTAGGHDDHNHDSGVGAMTLRGAFVKNDGTIYNDLQLDERICDCCSTGAAMTRNGPVVVYRDRSEDEVRDISIVRWVDNIWTEPETVSKDNWEIAGCPVNGPATDAIGNNVVVAWYTAAKDKPKVQVIFSEDGGASFGLPIRVDSHDTLGRVDVSIISENEAVVSWIETIGDDTLIQLLKVGSNGSKGDVVTLATTSASRASGFPQIEILNGFIYAAWTVIDSDDASKKSIQTARLGLDVF